MVILHKLAGLGLVPLVEIISSSMVYFLPADSANVDFRTSFVAALFIAGAHVARCVCQARQSESVSLSSWLSTSSASDI